MTRTTFLTVLILTLGSLVTTRLPAKDLVEIRVFGHFFSAPATVSVTVAVEPGARNRMLVVEADSDSYFRSSSTELDGENEKRLHRIEFRSLPAGQYVLRAQVLSKSEVLATDVQDLVVTGIQ